MAQIAGIGPVAVRKLVRAGISTIHGFLDLESYQIETLLSRNPPFGTEILKAGEAIPRLRLSLESTGQPLKAIAGINIAVKSQIGCLNQQVPQSFQRRPIFVIFMAERSDGVLLDFRRIAIVKLGKGSTFTFSATMTLYDQYITCYLMCDAIAGTLEQAELRPRIPRAYFQSKSPQAPPFPSHGLTGPESAYAQDLTTSRSLDAVDESQMRQTRVDCAVAEDLDAFEDYAHEFLDAKKLNRRQQAFVDIDELDHYEGPTNIEKGPSAIDRSLQISRKRMTRDRDYSSGEDEETVLRNGKYLCKHKCKDKKTCKHLCCHEGLDNPPKKPKKTRSVTNAPNVKFHRVSQQLFGHGNSMESLIEDDRRRPLPTENRNGPSMGGGKASLEKLDRQHTGPNVSSLARSLIQTSRFQPGSTLRSFTTSVSGILPLEAHSDDPEVALPNRAQVVQGQTRGPDDPDYGALWNEPAAFDKFAMMDSVPQDEPDTSPEHHQRVRDQSSGLFIHSESDFDPDREAPVVHDTDYEAEALGHPDIGLKDRPRSGMSLRCSAGDVRAGVTEPGVDDHAAGAGEVEKTPADLENDALDDEISREIYDILGPYVDFV